MRTARAATSALLDLFFPPHCCACGAPGPLLCQACIASVEPPPVRACRRCGEPAALDYCPACAAQPSPLDGIASAATFQSPVRQAIHALKYNGVAALAIPLGQLMAAAWPSAPFVADVIVPVALHPTRIRERGYNQSLLLARELSLHTGIPVDAGLLVRRRDTRPQVGLGQHERRANVAGAFDCIRSVSGLRVGLVDDVCTTGATLEACAAALKAAGAASAWGFTLARARWKPGDPPPDAL